LSAGDVYFDISMVEGVGGVARLAQKISARRVLFGSNYPLFYFESAMLKVRESGFTDTDRQAVLEENARRILAA
jgi:predicted TIM-barrel fold metal-dependent hydrolase